MRPAKPTRESHVARLHSAMAMISAMNGALPQMARDLRRTAYETIEDVVREMEAEAGNQPATKRSRAR